VSQKKLAKFNLQYLTKTYPVFKILSVLEKEYEICYKTHKTVHHTFNTLLHFLGKLKPNFGENFTVLLKTCFILLALIR